MPQNASAICLMGRVSLPQEEIYTYPPLWGQIPANDTQQDCIELQILQSTSNLIYAFGFNP